MRQTLIWFLLGGLSWLSGCMSQTHQSVPVVVADSNDVFMDFEDEDLDFFEEELAQETVTIPDPLEPINRFMFGINDGLYYLVLKPVGSGYKAIVVEPVRIGIKNFFNNLTTPVRWANCLLQGKGKAAGTELQRFFINSTEGVLGLGDPAWKKHGIQEVDEDLGQTLAVWGFDDGFYLVLPLLGPSTVRDGLGRLGDRFANPTQYVEPWEAYIAVSGTQFINSYSFHLEDYDSLKADSLDPYIAMRDIYLQYRQRQIEQ